MTGFSPGDGAGAVEVVAGACCGAGGVGTLVAGLEDDGGVDKRLLCEAAEWLSSLGARTICGPGPGGGRVALGRGERSCDHLDAPMPEVGLGKDGVGGALGRFGDDFAVEGNDGASGDFAGGPVARPELLLTGSVDAIDLDVVGMSGWLVCAVCLLLCLVSSFFRFSPSRASFFSRILFASYNANPFSAVTFLHCSKWAL